MATTDNAYPFAGIVGMADLKLALLRGSPLTFPRESPRDDLASEAGTVVSQTNSEHVSAAASGAGGARPSCGSG